MTASGIDRSSPLRQLDSTRFVRLLQEWSRVETEAVRLDVAERLSGWLGAMDTVTLDGALQTIESYPAQTRVSGAAVDAVALEAHVERVTAMLQGQLDPSVPDATPLPVRGQAAPAPAGDAVVRYAPYHQRYLDLQRRLEQSLGTLRAEVRQSLSRGSPALRQLVALDAVLDQMLLPRAQKLMASVPVLLERRFEHWQQAHRRLASVNPIPTDAAQWRRPGGWVHAFEHDMRELLLAELHLRLRPVLGLIEAARLEPPVSS